MNVRHLFILCGMFLLFIACKDSSKQKSLSSSENNPNHQYVIAVKSDIIVKEEPVNGKQVGLVERGEMCALIDSVDDWYKVSLCSGKEGYVSKEFSRVLSHDSIPREVFDAYCPLAERRVQYGDISFRLDGDHVFMARGYNSVPEDGNLWNSVYQGATIYYGTIERNRLVFTRSLSRFDADLETITPSEMEEIKPYNAYYSPAEGGFIFEGALFIAHVPKKLTPHPLSARKGLGLYGNVSSVTDSEGKTIFFNLVGNIMSTKGKNGYSEVYRYNDEGTEYSINDFGPYVITYSDHKRSDMRAHEFDTEGSVEYLFDEQDRIIERKEQVRMSYVTETFSYTGTNLLPDSKSTHDYDETGDYRVTDKYEYLEVDEHGNWLKRKVVRIIQSREHTDSGEAITTTETEPERIETQTLEYFNN